jgi:hypothetical protein
LVYLEIDHLLPQNFLGIVAKAKIKKCKLYPKTRPEGPEGER